MKVLVTGGAGFIGSHLMRYLKARGDEPTALDNLSTGRREHLADDMEFIEMDVRDERLAGVVATGQYDAIVHLAGQTFVSDSLDDPAADADSNVLGTVRVLEAARQSGVKRVVFSSTAAAYGDAPERDLPIKEAHKLAPMSFYGLSKVTAERYLELYHQCFGLDYVALRFANVYGERQGDGGEGGVISIFTRLVAAGEEITIFGDGEQTRDFIYAGDIASGVAAALTTAQANVVYNLSTQTQTSLRELVDVLSNVAGRQIIPKYGPERPGDIYKSSLSNARAKRGLGWNPTVSLEEGLRRTYRYFYENLANQARKGE
ncbi:MAG: NAD-dependent epimerase/dehydratase family protein [Selenomonadaceae bacterium]|nr:NAD-dependent epimerase/dehydratase family protein [Selenomonadaceae bacterium]